MHELLNIFSVLVIKTLDLDPDQMNTDPQPCFAVFSMNVQIPLCFSYNCILLAGYRRPHDGHAEQMVVAAPAHSLPRDSS
jgi:hypothetical protein